jgi:hypothetical protein
MTSGAKRAEPASETELAAYYERGGTITQCPPSNSDELLALVLKRFRDTDRSWSSTRRKGNYAKKCQ